MAQKRTKPEPVGTIDICRCENGWLVTVDESVSYVCTDERQLLAMIIRILDIKPESVA